MPATLERSLYLTEAEEMMKPYQGQAMQFANQKE